MEEYTVYTKDTVKEVDKIYIKDGVKRKWTKSKEWRKCCQIYECIKYARGKSSFCSTHKEEKILNKESKFNTIRKILKEKAKIEGNIEVIGTERYIYRGQQYVKICGFNSCNKRIYEDGYCVSHPNGKELTQDEINQKKEKYRLQSLQFLEIGEQSEEYIMDILSKIPILEYSKSIGYEKDKCDIVYKLKKENVERGLQVKTLTLKKNKNYYTVYFKRNKYNEDMLIVGVNKERDKFLCVLYKDCSKTGLNLIFNPNTKSKYSQYCYTDLEKFIKNLSILLPKSNVYEPVIAISTYKEKEMLNMLEDNCLELNYTYNREKTNMTVIDCRINNYRIQCKSSSKLHRLKYKFGMKKSKSSENSRKAIPYEDTDPIDFFIFNIIENPNDFFIVPKNILIEKGFITTKSNKGKTDIYIYSPDSDKEDWVLEYLNNFELLALK